MRITEKKLRSVIRKKIITELFDSNYERNWGGGNDKEEFKNGLINWYKSLSEKSWKQCCENIRHNIVFRILGLSRKKDGEAPTRFGEYNIRQLHRLRSEITNSTDTNFSCINSDPRLENLNSYKEDNFDLLKGIVKNMQLFFELEDWLDILEEVCVHHKCLQSLTLEIKMSRSFLESERENI